MIAIATTTLTSSGLVRTGPGALVAVNLCAAGGSATVTIYANTAGSGDVLCKLAVAANTSDSFTPAAALAASVGLYATITGTTPTVSISYL